MSPFVQGEVWANKDNDLTTAQQASVAEQIGSLLAKGSLDEPSAAMVDSFVRPSLQRIADSAFDGSDDVPALQVRIGELLGELDIVKKLPLALVHEDVNAMNVLV